LICSYVLLHCLPPPFPLGILISQSLVLDLGQSVVQQQFQLVSIHLLKLIPYFPRFAPMCSCIICHHYFHLRFLSPKAWFWTLGKMLFNNNSSNSFNLLCILTCIIWVGLFNWILANSNCPFQSWIWAWKAWVYFSRFMLVRMSCSFWS
jgi:hypothetical protein